MKKTTLNQVLGIFGICILAIVLLSCPDESRVQEQLKPDDLVQEQQDRAVVSFSVVTDSLVRTVLPQVSLANVSSYKLLGGIGGTTEAELLEFTNEDFQVSVELALGTWNFTLNAYDEDDVHILQGRVQNRQISLTGTNQVTFSLSAMTAGVGAIQITVNFPEEAGITKISTSGDVASENFTTISNGSFVYTKNDFAAGNHVINFELYRGDILRTIVSELVLVRGNLTSSKTITLVGDDLKPLLIGTVSITGTAVVGEILTANVDDLDGAGSISYQWKRGETNIGTNSSAYTLVTADVNSTITVAVTRVGYSGSVTSIPTLEVCIPPSGVTINLTSMSDWELLEQTFEVIPNTNNDFTVTGDYSTYRWYLDGVSVGTSSSYGFSKPIGVYQLVVMVTDSNGGSRSGRCRVTVNQAGTIFMENFEGATHLFTMVNGSLTNKWQIGTAVAYGGTKSAYISNDNGTSNVYTLTSSSSVHMYRDVTFPASTEPYTLSFYWRAEGESSSYDYLRLFLTETTFTPVAGTLPTESTTIINLGTFNLGGATIWNLANISIPVAYSGTTKRLVFTWYNDSSGGNQPPVAVDNIVLSISAPTVYTVSFGANNGSGTVPVTQTVSAGSCINLPSGSGLTRSGNYIFGGWNTNSSGTGTDYDAGALYLPTDNVTLYARWISTYTVTFSANNGTGSVPAQKIIAGSIITLPGGSGLTRSSFTFSGWNTSSSGTGTNYDASTPYTPTGDVTLYARWK